jgi:plastocyanin
MTEKLKQVPQAHLLGLGALCVALVLLAGLSFGVGRGSAKAPIVEFTLSAEASRFNGDNPTLVVSPGARVRIVLENRERDPVPHNIKIAGAGVRCTEALFPGEAEVVTFTAPSSGVLTYTCCLHPQMSGKIVIGAQYGR